MTSTLWTKIHMNGFLYSLKDLKVIDTQMNIQMRNQKLLKQMEGELEYAVKCRYNKIITLDDIANTLQDVRKRTHIGEYSQFRRSIVKEKQPFRVDFKDKPKGKMEELSKGKEEAYCIAKVPEEESSTEDFGSESMGDAIREQSDDEEDPREEFLVEYQEETQIEIQDIQLEAGSSQSNENKNWFKHSQDAQKFLLTPTKVRAYIHGTATKMTVFIENAQHPLIIDSGAHFSIVAKCFVNNHFLNLEKQLLETKARKFKSASRKITSIHAIIKEIIIPYRKGNTRLKPEFVVLDDSHIQGFLLRADFQRMYGIDICNCKNRHITIGTNKEKKIH
ncbi:hypothetical protein O181_051860 [Austropuccinia psidii MF-1]|uniref:Uncharacterized protein n=1 Tax=Austropuccinia psidii MF-1 TaxID=1389203 RepID=A0A9Q3DXV8_9BASI|nr:hypothetical protein [Austropuccinia psidii MF-1]